MKPSWVEWMVMFVIILLLAVFGTVVALLYSFGMLAPAVTFTLVGLLYSYLVGKWLVDLVGRL